MEAPRDDNPAALTRAPLFLLSFRQRDELAALAASAGWSVVAARRSDGAERRFAASGAAIAVVDARGAAEEGLIAARALGRAVAAGGAAMLVLVSSTDSGRIGDFFTAGATHFLVSPMREHEFLQALRFAERHVERVAGWTARPLGPVEPLGWRYDPELRSLQLTPALAAQLAIGEAATPRAFLSRIAGADRLLARAALRRLGPDAPTTAFAHELVGLGRVVEHLQLDPRTGRLHALIEPLGLAPDAGAAVRDALTGVRDAASARRWIERRLSAETPVMAMLIALTRFETVNTAYGRAAGDGLLRLVSKRLGDIARDALGRSAMVARTGGSEFVVAVEGNDAERLAQARGQAADALARPFVVGDAIVPIGARIATVVSIHGDDAAMLLRRASEALHDPRSEPTGAGAPLDRLASDLRAAMEAGAIGVRFQPQVAISTGTIVGVEALARWHHPEFGELGAETLFAAASRAGLDLAVSDHVQKRALECAAGWPATLAKLRLSINVTAGDVARPGFADALLDRVDASGFPRARLTVEITESGIMEELGEAARLLSELRTAGCRVAIDDFGTGYSSLAYLKALPLDYLKIDRKLTQDITGSPRDRIVVRGVIDMARSLGLSVIAEGVETEQQLELLAKDGCNYYQGFLCAPPVDIDALARLVEERG
ncbi:MAG: putative bifunctional diguanylate cyclase/phosphodiesterase [Pseudomonadota bacterium]